MKSVKLMYLGITKNGKMEKMVILTKEAMLEKTHKYRLMFVHWLLSSGKWQPYITVL